MRTVLVALAVLMCTPVADAQPMAPDEVAVRYVQSLYPSVAIRTTTTTLDPYFCRAYGLLSQRTRSAIPLVTFMAAARWIQIGAIILTVGTPYVEGDTASVRLTIRTEHWLLGTIQRSAIIFAHLAREQGSWRMVLTEDAIRELVESARKYNGVVPMSICG